MSNDEVYSMPSPLDQPDSIENRLETKSMDQTEAAKNNHRSPLDVAESPSCDPAFIGLPDVAVPCVDPIEDSRLYVPDNEDWGVHIKRDSEKIYCYSKHPGQDWFHLVLSGEIYLTRQHERYCLRCALRMGFITHDRLFWQHRVPKKPVRVL